jgi:sugar phosphate isomerase/epimerase
MLGARDIVLCSAMCMTASLREKVKAASRAGYWGLSVSATDYAGARAEGLSDEDIRDLIAEEGLTPTDAEAVTQWLAAVIDPARSDRRAAEEKALFSAAAAIECQAVVAIHFSRKKVDVNVAAEAFAGLCDRAYEHGLNVHLEFLPWTGIANLRAARAIVEAAGRANGRLVIDAWHLHRSGGELSELAGLPGHLVGSVQLSDAPAQPQESLLEETLHARLLPGEGTIDLVGLLRTLDAIGAVAPIGIEVLSDRLNALPVLTVAEQAIAAVRKVLAGLRPGETGASPDAPVGRSPR